MYDIFLVQTQTTFPYYSICIGMTLHFEKKCLDLKPCGRPISNSPLLYKMHGRIAPLFLMQLSTLKKIQQRGLRQTLEIFFLKDRILKRLQSIQMQPNYSHSYFLQNLEQKLIKDFNHIMRMKEDYWKLKSRINWLNNGDTNTKFFHTSTIISHHKNRIVSLTLEDNSIIYKQANILKLTKDYFVIYSLLTTTNISNSKYP